MPKIVITGSARKHGLDPDEVKSVMLDAVYMEPGFQESRQDDEGRREVTLFVGVHPADRERAIEVIGEAMPSGDFEVFHAMDAKPRHLARVEDQAALPKRAQQAAREYLDQAGARQVQPGSRAARAAVDRQELARRRILRERAGRAPRGTPEETRQRPDDPPPRQGGPTQHGPRL